MRTIVLCQDRAGLLLRSLATLQVCRNAAAVYRFTIRRRGAHMNISFHRSLFGTQSHTAPAHSTKHQAAISQQPSHRTRPQSASQPASERPRQAQSARPGRAGPTTGNIISSNSNHFSSSASLASRHSFAIQSENIEKAAPAPAATSTFGTFVRWVRLLVSQRSAQSRSPIQQIQIQIQIRGAHTHSASDTVPATYTSVPVHIRLVYFYTESQQHAHWIHRRNHNALLRLRLQI